MIASHDDLGRSSFSSTLNSARRPVSGSPVFALDKQECPDWVLYLARLGGILIAGMGRIANAECPVLDCISLQGVCLSRFRNDGGWVQFP